MIYKNFKWTPELKEEFQWDGKGEELGTLKNECHDVFEDILKGMYDKRAKELNLPAILENDPFGLNKLSRQFIKAEIFKKNFIS